jgi:hypothetical protein
MCIVVDRHGGGVTETCSSAGIWKSGRELTPYKNLNVVSHSTRLAVLLLLKRLRLFLNSSLLSDIQNPDVSLNLRSKLTFFFHSHCVFFKQVLIIKLET